MSTPARRSTGSSGHMTPWIVAGALIALAALGGSVAHWARGGGARGAAGAALDAEPAAAALVAFESFVVNLADPGVERYLKVGIRIVTADPDAARRLRADELAQARIRDRAISTLSSKYFEELTRPGGKDELRRQLRREINQTLPDDLVSEVLFVEFVLR